ncbi:peptidoglycan-binding protein [Pedobacter lusitanus]|uniref:Peptidoglycan-binding protein n=1 Tax=Pedobacter lusitanus TaxID=1503925 RepID=A0A0D0GLQ8_9SPHI|nr:LysM peptidoglycan-binding domain-containing protein [Pedobacter lusitanus]KIO78177.1 peptidoglycan-binding protein [Pedobacter lusitanus]
MQKYYIPLLFGLFLNLSAVKADNLRDSIGVENLHGKKLILHQVVAKDTYYSLGRRYNVSPKDIIAYNENKFLSIGVLIKVPTNIPFSGPVAATPVKTEVTKHTEPVKQAVVVNKPAENTATDQGNSEFTEHAVQPKENLMMLARQYGTTVADIKRINDLKTINLKIGQILKMPVKAGGETASSTPLQKTPVQTTPVQTAQTNPAVTTPAHPTPPPVQVPVQEKKPEIVKKQETPVVKTEPVVLARQESPDKNQFLEHIVASNETMYSIATKYNLTLDQLKAKNNLTTNSLFVGQKLLINGQYPVKAERNSNEDTKDADTIESVKNPSLRLPASRYGLSQMDEKGAGVWITDKDLDPSKMLVLHRSAPIGTIMKITNPMSNRSTFAKVVGKFTENESTKDVIIVVTKAVADALGALDKRFLCNLTYSGQANEQ